MFYAAIATKENNWMINVYNDYLGRNLARKDFLHRYPMGKWINITRNEVKYFIGHGKKMVYSNGYIENDIGVHADHIVLFADNSNDMLNNAILIFD